MNIVRSEKKIYKKDTHISEEQQVFSWRKGHSWRAGIGTIIVVACVISLSALVFVSLAHRHDHAVLPSSGQWEVLTGYTVTSLSTAPSNSSILYACALPVSSSPEASTSNSSHLDNGPTVFRSMDAGVHWQDIGAKARLIGYCQLAVNSINSDEVYVVTRSEHFSNDGNFTSVLKHTTDGGKTWSALVPVLQFAGLRSPLTWPLQDFSMAGDHLFGLEELPQRMSQPQQQRAAHTVSLCRLVSSSDGGQVWTVLDPAFHVLGLEVNSYVVDPSSSSTIYELIGRPLSGAAPANPSLEPLSTPIVPPNGADEDLYGTRTSGADWQPILKGLPLGLEVQLAGTHPTMLYVGGTMRSLPAGANGASASSFSVSSHSNDSDTFFLRVTSDGGKTWNEVAPLPGRTPVQTWLVGPDGRVIADSRVETTDHTLYIYDPTRNSWSQLNTPQSIGALVAVTPIPAMEGTALWFSPSAQKGGGLYRYVL